MDQLKKIHKQGNPLRPVVSMIGTAGYGLAKYLDSYIKPCIPKDYMLNSTMMFLDKLRSFTFNANDKLVSFDVVSLFTNVPLEETIDIIADTVYQQPQNNQPPFKKLIFKRMLKLATGGMFCYNGKLYQQIDGVTMGSPLGPTLANFFLAHLEQKFMNDHGVIKPRLYLRYVDDIFSVFDGTADFQNFLDILNSQHPNLKFTIEVGGSNLAFLDTEITIHNADFEIMVYRKPTNTNVILNNSAMCPGQWKIGLAKCLLHRAWSICSNYQLLHNEITKLKSIFVSNGYSKMFFDKVVKS